MDKNRCLTYLCAAAMCGAFFPAISAPLSAQAKGKTWAAALAAAPGWTEVYKDSALTVDLHRGNTKAQRDGTYLVHLRWTHRKDKQIEKDRHYRIMVEDRLLNCKDESSKPVNAVATNAAGKIVSSYTTPVADLQYLEWSIRKPGSPNAKAFTAVCKALTAKK